MTVFAVERNVLNLGEVFAGCCLFSCVLLYGIFSSMKHMMGMFEHPFSHSFFSTAFSQHTPLNTIYQTGTLVRFILYHNEQTSAVLQEAATHGDIVFVHDSGVWTGWLKYMQTVGFG